MGKEWAAGEYMHLLSPGDMEKLLADAGISTFRLVRNRLVGFTLDFVVVI